METITDSSQINDEMKTYLRKIRRDWEEPDAVDDKAVTRKFRIALLASFLISGSFGMVITEHWEADAVLFVCVVISLLTVLGLGFSGIANRYIRKRKSHLQWLYFGEFDHWISPPPVEVQKALDEWRGAYVAKNRSEVICTPLALASALLVGITIESLTFSLSEVPLFFIGAAGFVYAAVRFFRSLTVLEESWMNYRAARSNGFPELDYPKVEYEERKYYIKGKRR